MPWRQGPRFLRFRPRAGAGHRHESSLCEINSHGRWRWLEHTLAMPGWRYCALLLNWQWPAAAGLGRILERHPFSYCYLLRWRLDFSGEKSPPHQHAWFVWDRDWIGAEPAFRFMDRADGERLVEADLFA